MSSAYFTTVTSSFFLNAGRSVTGVDINGDGFSDIIIGADQAENTSNELVGQVVVIYGSGSVAAFPTSTFDLDSAGMLDGSDGFYISGGNPDGEFGWDVLNAGDQNGDGRDDLAIASRADGTVTVLFGQTSSSTGMDLSGGVGTDGYVITGLGTFLDDVILSGGASVNGDAIADLIIGVSGSGGTDVVHVIYGDGNSSGLDVSALDGTNGFSVTGIELLNTNGFNIGTIGNLDGAGPDDIVLGRFDDDPNTGASGDIVIMRGTAAAQSATFDVDTLAATETIILTGLTADVASSASVAGDFDINGDGIDDLAIGVANDDTSALNAGAIYVVFGDAGIGPTVDLTTLDGTNGFAITGLAASDALGLVTQSLGDVSGDGRDDLGILTAAGDLYVIYGIESPAIFGATVSLNTLNGSNGYAITGLFDTTPETLSLAGLPSVNGDDINDISVGATFDLGATGETIVILGGAQNFQNLDDADDDDDDGTIDFSQIGEVTFADTDSTIILGGDTTGERTEDETAVNTGSISVQDTGGGTPSFAGRTGTGGQYGGLVVNGAGDTWTYTISGDQAVQDQVQALNDGDSLFDTLNVTTGDGSATQTITIEITGIDDPAVFAGDIAPVMSEDISQATFSYTLTDVDDDDPSLAGLRFDGTSAYIEFNAAGDAYTVFQIDPSLQNMGNGDTDGETIMVTDSAGNDFDIVLTFQGGAEGVPLVTTSGDDDIFTSYGDDVIQALDGDDNINPGAGDDNVDAGAGNDTVVDGLGNDTVDGGDDNDNILLLTGENSVDGGSGSDFIRTGYKSDMIEGGAGNDVISADSGALFVFGNDTVDGGTGDDIMQAGAGIDTFVFRPNDGDDTIARFDEDLALASFDAATGYTGIPNGSGFEAGIDKIALDGFTGLNATTIFASINDTSDGALFDNGEGTTILFFNVFEAQLSETDFIFIT